jgi:hypothetical protein
LSVSIRTAWKAWVVVVVCAAASALLDAAAISRVTPVARDGRLLVTFELLDGFTDEIRAAIDSGLTTTFTYDIELRRATAVWVDRTIATATVSASVHYDSLTRWYEVTRVQDGRVEGSFTTERLDDVRNRMTKFEKLSVFSTADLEPNAEYYVRVRARMRPRNFSLVGVWERVMASAIGKFTFIP